MWWPIRRNRLSETSQITVGGKTLRLWKDAVALSNQAATVDLPIVFVADSAALAAADVRGKAVAMELPSITTQSPEQFTIRGNFQSTVSQMARARAAAIAQRGAAAAILLSNGSANIDEAFDAMAEHQGHYRIVAGATDTLHIGDLTLDVAGHEVRRGETRINLTPLEFELLLALASKPRSPTSSPPGSTSSRHGSR